MSAARRRARALTAPPRLVPATIAARLTIWIWAAYAIWQGIRIVIGGPQRWGGPSFTILRMVPHATLSWGSILITLGVALVFASLLRLFWLKAVACIGIAIWSLCFAYGALTAAAQNPQTASTGAPTYAAIAASILVLVFIDERRKPPPVA